MTILSSCITERNWSPYQGYVMLNFADGGASDFTAYQILSARGLVATSYIPANAIDAGGRLTLSNVQLMYGYGWDFGNHGDGVGAGGHEAFSYLSIEQIEASIAAGKTALDTPGFTRASNFLSVPGETPAGPTSAADIATAITAAGVTNTLTTLSALYPGRIGAVDIADATPATVNAGIKASVEVAQFCIVGFHDLIATPTSGYHYNATDFQTIADYLVTRGYRTVTITQLWALINA